MLKLLIADSSLDQCKAVKNALQEDFDAYYCVNSEEFTQLLYGIAPDVLILDLSLPGMDSTDILRAANTAGICPHMLVLATHFDDYVYRRLQGLNVCHTMYKPYLMEAVVACIEDIQISLQVADDAQLEQERNIHAVLLSLGFTKNKGGYMDIFHSLQFICQNPQRISMKALYKMLIDTYGGTYSQLEKAIRDSIQKAWKNRNETVWQAYFPLGRNGRVPCPTNSVFFAQLGSKLTDAQNVPDHIVQAQ